MCIYLKNEAIAFLTILVGKSSFFQANFLSKVQQILVKNEQLLSGIDFGEHTILFILISSTLKAAKV